MNSDKNQKGANFSLKKRKLSKEELEYQKNMAKRKKQIQKLQQQLEKKFEYVDRREEKKLREAKKREASKKTDIDDTSIIPSISLEEFNNREKKVEKRESIFSKLLNALSSSKKTPQEKEFLKQQNEARKEEKAKLVDGNKESFIERWRKRQEANKLERERIRKEKEENKKQEAIQRENEKKERLLEKEKTEEKLRGEKEAEKQAKIAEKERKKEEKELLNTKNITVVESNSDTNTMSKEDKKKLEAQTREEKKKRKEELRQARLKEEYEEKARRKKEKEDKEILLMTEKREKENKIKKEKEQARKERKEKALLIKKAQEESKQKARKERKTFEERFNDWYNNLSFVKDRKNRREMQRQTLLIDFEGADAIRSAEKIMYKYVAKNNDTGKVETGYFAAFSKLDVHSFLMSEGYEVYEITPQKNIGKSLSFASPKFKATELDFFLTQLSTFLRSGITLVESVKILSKQSKKRAHKNVYKSIIYELTMGENFSEALSKQGNVFPRLLINMVKTSELTGDLPETLDDMANYYKETEKTRKQMISAMTYPLVVLSFAIVILIFMLIKVVPQFVGIYNNLEADLPGITIAVLKASNFLRTKWLILLVSIVVFVVVFIVLYKTIKVFKSLVQTLVMNIPVVGKIIIYNEVTMFTKTFASLLNHNVYITDCMEVLSKITSNEVYKMLIFDTMTNLARGEAISNSFKNHWAFPSIAYEMILTGEKTGQLGVMMDKVADYYQEQHKNAVNQIKAFIEPVMIVLLAAIVGVILLSVVIPMFDMYENLSQQV